MSAQRRSEVLGNLPHSRPHRRSDRRTARSSQATGATTGSTATAGPAKPRAMVRPAKPRSAAAPSTPTPAQPGRHELLGTAVQAAGELAEIGLTLGARALREALSRLPRP